MRHIGLEDKENERIVDNKISLIPYYDNYDLALSWYQDYDLCKQVDNIEYLYDNDMLIRMYEHLSSNGLCYYIKYEDTLIGDVSLTNSNEVCIVISKPFQNMGIGKKVIKEIIKLAKEKELTSIKANIYSFNKQSQKAFESLGFKAYKNEWYEFKIDDNMKDIGKEAHMANENKIAIQDTYGERFQHCWGCGPKNESGMHLKSYPSEDGLSVICKVIPDEKFTGGVPQNLFGGMIAMIFDCHGTASAAFFKHKDLGLELTEDTIIGRFITARLEVDYKKPTPMGEEITVIARANEIGDRKVIVDMEMYALNELCAKARMVAVAVKDSM